MGTTLKPATVFFLGLAMIATVPGEGRAAAPRLSKQAIESASRMTVYVGTYTSGDSKGIYRLSLDLKTGRLTKLGVTGGVRNPSFLAIHPNKRFLYAVSEVSSVDGKKTGAVTAFAIDRETGELKKINWQSSGGAGPCHLVVDRAGKAVLVANYGGGSVASLPIAKNGG
ncbi:MAG: lactonase family protein, partial [Planctomycetaceae bacterium]